MLRIYLVLFLSALVLSVRGAYDPFHIRHPNIFTEAPDSGFLSFHAGQTSGNVHFRPSQNNTVYIDGTDMRKIIELVMSQPPIWEDHKPFGFLGKYFGGQTIDIQLEATDPEGTRIEYHVVAGDTPPGVTVDRRGRVTGLIPDEDATYVFTVRATDVHNKFADEVMKIVTRDSDACRRHPCQHEGVCHDEHLDYRCVCIHPFGGKNCQYNCSVNRLGVGSRSRISNSQMSAYNTYSTYYAYNGRLGGSGWQGAGSTSWLQVDLGNVSDIYAVDMQSINTNYYTSQYQLKYSTDGRTFSIFEDSRGSGTPLVLHGSTGTVRTNLPRVLEARYIRFVPTRWGSRPGMRVDIIGCHKY